MISFVDKYAPKSVNDIIGQDVNSLIKHAKSNPRGKACLICGPAGTGKTSSVHALANSEGYEFIEINASDLRDAESIKSVVGNACMSAGLFGKRIILVDDIDSMSGEDRGGITELISCIKSTRVPIFLTALDAWEPKIRTLKNYCDVINFKKVRTSSIRDLLRKVCTSEGITASDSVLYKIASHADGDVRAGLNDLEMLSVSNKELTEYDLEVMGFREKPVSIFDGLQKLFKTDRFMEALDSLQDVDMDMGTKFLWVVENVTNEYSTSSEVAKAFDYLSRADVFNGRIMRREYWRFLVYVNALMTVGVNSSRESPSGFVRYKNPSRILRLWQTKSSRELRKALAVKFQPFVNASARKTINEVLPYMKFFLKDASFGTNYELTDDELDFLKK